MDVAQYRDGRADLVSGNTVKNEINTLSAVFEACRTEWGMNVNNPARGVKRPTATAGRDRRLYPGEYELLKAACANSKAWYLHSMVQLAIETGMRQGELAALRWEHIDLQKQVAFLPMTKNGTARTVPLSSRAVQVLQSVPRRIDGALFCVVLDSIKHAFKAAMIRGRADYVRSLKVQGVTQEAIDADQMLINLRFHDCRHEATSALSCKGCCTRLTRRGRCHAQPLFPMVTRSLTL